MCPKVPPASGTAPPAATSPVTTPANEAAPTAILFFVILYSISSSTLSVVNKWAVTELPYPGLLTACQFFATAAFTGTLGKLGVIQVDPLEYGKVLAFVPINVIFYTAILANNKVLQYSTVETFIALRSLSPLLVCAIDTVVRSEPWPSLRTVGTLWLIAAGATTYARGVDMEPVGIAWAVLYLAIIVTEMVYAKHITATIGLSTWGLVFYQNALAVFLWPIASLLTGEFWSLSSLLASKSIDSVFTASAIAPLSISCVFSVAISFSAWGTRANISATQFTVLGIACKLATVFINFFVWEQHASLVAQLAVVTCIVASVLYSKSAQRDREDATKAAGNRSSTTK